MEGDEVNIYFNDGSIEQRSLCLALIRQTMSGNEPDVEYLRHYSYQAFPSEIHKGFNYMDYPQDRWTFIERIAENIPDWPCLNLKPEILEEAIRTCLSQHNLNYFKAVVNDYIGVWFVFHQTGKYNFWYGVSDALKQSSNTSKEINIKQPIKTQKDEIKFQRKKGRVLRGTVPEGNQQSSGKCKTATCSGHLGYQICSG